MLGGPARKRSSGPAGGVEREGQADQAVAESELIRGGRGRHTGEGRGQDEVDARRGFGQLLSVALSLGRRALVLGVAHLETAFDLLADVVPVRVRVLEEKLLVDVGDLAAEGVVEVMGQWQVEPPSAREKFCCRFDTGL